MLPKDCISKFIYIVSLVGIGVGVEAQTPISNKPNPLIIKVTSSSLQPNQNLDVYSSSMKTNYVRVREAVAPITEPSIMDGEGYEKVKQTTQYLDGLGRPLQTVIRQSTPGNTPNDLVMPVIYDQYGRESLKYLPYIKTTGSNASDGSFKLNPFNEQDVFYKSVYRDANNNPMYNGEKFLYGETRYEPSPLNRITKSLAPGDSWVGNDKGVLQQYLVNIPGDAVHIWNIANVPLEYEHSNPDDANYIPTTLNTTEGIYPAGELYKNVVTDENGYAVVEYKDKSGQVILKKVQNGTVASDYSGYTNWLCTYYVYDDFNQLRFVIPPKAVEVVIANSWTLSGLTTVINELCFRYEYDSRQRMIAKKIPGAGWTYLLYDQLDRLTFTQDANLRNDHHFLGIVYDQLSRPVSTGILTYGSGAAALQAYLNSGAFFSGFILNRHGIATSPSIPVIITNRRTPGLQYRATESIIFEYGFISEANADYSAEIIKAIAGESFIETVPIITSPLPAGYPYVELVSTYYDDYSQIANIGSKLYTDNLNGKLVDVGASQNAEDMLSQNDQSKVSTIGMVTGKRVRVLSDPNDLSTGSMLTSIIYYDQKGRPIQVHSENNSGGTDITINRYDFSGKVLSNYLVQNNPHSMVPTVKVKTDMIYDHAGRLLEIWKTMNDEEGKKALISKNAYDQMGQLLKKEFGRKRDATGSYTSTAMETLDYNYNVRGWLKGINAAYSHPELNSGVSPERWFGMELNYDWGSEKGTGFDRNQYNGNISSLTWKSKGDGVRRAYGFSYDNVNRIIGADFSELNGSSYAQSNIDFSMVMGNTTTAAYDANGNIGAMKQMGLKLTGSVPLDQLTYEYYPNTNKLRSVQDAVTDDNKMGDFTDKNTGDDYGYDANGNLVTDLNKSIGTTTATGTTPASPGAIAYNHLNLPYRITVKDKGTITYIYDAEGNKLEKKVEEVSTKGPMEKRTTSYIGGTVYEQNVLQFISHEEGRTRFNTENPSIIYNNDFFLKDHLGNVRTVLTDEVSPVQIYKATMEEGNRRQIEVDQFGDKITSSATPKVPGFDGGSGQEESANQRIAVVNGSNADTRIGPGIVLKVMAGDKIKANTFAWYQPGGNTSADPNLPSILSALLPLFSSGASAAGKIVGNLSEFTTATSALTTFLTNQSNSASPVKAYLNWVLLDGETLSLVPGSSSATPVPEILSGSNKVALLANGGSDIEIIKNGYIYIYVSNESRQNVYFDDLTIQHMRGPLLEETHYYPFGLTMAGISSKAVSEMANREKFGGKEEQREEYSDGSGLELLDFGARMYDAQIGRWHSPDQLGELYYPVSPYAYSANNPISYTDIDGRDFILTITRNKEGEISGINISSIVYIQGDGANDKRAGELTEFASNNLQTKKVDGITVSFGVNYKYDSKKKEKDLKEGENILKFDKAPENDENISHVNSIVRNDGDGRSTTFTGRKGTVYGSGQNNHTVLHETMHLLGLDDRYDDFRGNHLPGMRPKMANIGYENDIMASQSNTLTKAQYQRYIQTADIRSKQHRSDVLNFKINIDIDNHRNRITPFEPGGIHKFHPQSNR